MKRSKRLQPVARVARQHERNAASKLGDRLRETERHQQQLANLKQYRDEYIAGFNAAGQQGLTAFQLRDYRLFLKRLDDAIMQQQQQLAASLANCEQSQSDWRSRYGHSQMIDKLIQSRKLDENHESNQREQREQDDRPASSTKDDV